MHEQDKAILQGLVCVAWSDGKFEDREREMLDALLEGFHASDEEKSELASYAAEKKGLDDIPLNELSFGDRRNLFNHAVVLTWIDGEQHDDEVKFLEALRDKLHITEDEAQEISAVATTRAKELLAAEGG